MTGAGVTGAQTALAERFVVDCKVNPALLADHVNTKKFDVTPPDPAGLIVIASTGRELEVAPDTNVGENTEVLSPAAPWLKSIAPT